MSTSSERGASCRLCPCNTPKKPQEVADDLESAVYILVQMMLHFHRHGRSPGKLAENLTADEIRKVNGTNEQLASFVSTFFYEQFECDDGYWSGGNTKRVWLQTTSLPVELDTAPGEDTLAPLDALLDALYTLLRRHYAAINYADLGRFKATKKTHTITAETTEDKSHAGALTDGPSKLATVEELPAPPKNNFGILARLKTRRTEPQGQQSAPQLVKSRNITVPAVENPQRVLDNHEEILKAFEDILYDGDDPRDMTKYKNDKWYDQFDGLKSTFSASDRNPSGSSGTRKRRNDTAWDEYRRKRVRGLTWRIPAIPQTVVEEESDEESDEASA